MSERMMVDFDDTDRTLRVWLGATLVGEMRPDLSARGPECPVMDAPWSGWLASVAVIELLGTYQAAQSSPLSRT